MTHRWHHTQAKYPWLHGNTLQKKDQAYYRSFKICVWNSTGCQPISWYKCWKTKQHSTIAKLNSNSIERRDVTCKVINSGKNTEDPTTWQVSDNLHNFLGLISEEIQHIQIQSSKQAYHLKTASNLRRTNGMTTKSYKAHQTFWSGK